MEGGWRRVQGGGRRSRRSGERMAECLSDGGKHCNAEDVKVGFAGVLEGSAQRVRRLESSVRR